MQTLQKLESEDQKQLLILFGTALLFWMGAAMLLPTIPTHLEDIGFPTSEIGIIIGAYAIGLLLVRPSLGKMADTKGRTTVLVIGCLVAATAPLGYLVFTKLWPLFLLRIYHGLSIAAFTTAYIALAADISPPAERGEIMGYMSLANPIGVALGPGIAGYFLGTTDSYTAIFLISAGLGLSSFWLATMIREKPLPMATHPPTSALSSIVQTLLNPALAVPTGVLFLLGFPFGALHTFIPLYLKSMGNPLNPGLFYTLAAIASFAARFIFGRMTDRYGRGVFIFLSLIGYTASMALLSVANSAPLFLLAALLEGLSLGTLLPTTIALLADRCPPDRRGTVFSIGIAGLDVGLAIASPVFGLFVGRIGYPGIFAIAASLVLNATLLFALQSNPTVRSSLRFAGGLEIDRFSEKPLEP
jgi:MFS family permease